MEAEAVISFYLSRRLSKYSARAISKDKSISNSTNVMYMVTTSLQDLKGEKEKFRSLHRREATATVWCSPSRQTAAIHSIAHILALVNKKQKEAIMATKRKDGRLMQSITDPRTGKRVYFYGKTKAELNRQILAYRETAASGRPFSTVAEEWWKKEEPHLAVQSVKVYRPALRRAIAFFGSRCLSEITHQDIALYLKDLADAGFAAKTVSNHRIVVNKVFTYAIASDGLTHNPCASVPVPKGLAKVKRDAASKEDENIVLSSPDKWIYPYIAILTGMRKGEILALQWRDVDFDRNLIRVTKSVAHNGDTPFIKEPKTSAGCRVVPLLPALREVLWERKGRPERFIVSDDGTKPLTKRRYATLMKHYKQDTGFTATAHRLRHSFATLAFEENVPAKSLQEILGHKQLSTTMDTYTDFREKALRDAAEAMKTIGTKKP